MRNVASCNYTGQSYSSFETISPTCLSPAIRRRQNLGMTTSPITYLHHDGRDFDIEEGRLHVLKIDMSRGELRVLI